jgi:hypothetical protein
MGGVLAGSSVGSVVEVVRSGAWKDGFGAALDGGSVVACCGDFDLLSVVQHAVAMASLVG